jgi:hypothetical protein
MVEFIELVCFPARLLRLILQHHMIEQKRAVDKVSGLQLQSVSLEHIFNYSRNMDI